MSEHTASGVHQLKNKLHSHISSSNKGAGEMEFGSRVGRKDDEYNGVGCLEISKILAVLGTFFTREEPVTEVY